MDGGVEAEQFGQYRLEEMIGRGGMGEVYRAFDTIRGRIVALKRLPPHLASDAEFQARFRKESALAARLSEAHIVPIHDFGEIDGRLYLDMRLVNGRDLGSVLAEDGPLAPEQAAAVVAQVASALDAAHADGLVHRDVKPSNALLTGEPGREFVYLVDFGIARSVDVGTSLTVTGATVGTPDYMAPERFLETGSDHRVDVYALACLLFEALTGDKPFRGEGLPAMMHAHLNTEPPKPSRHSAGVPVRLDEVVATGMAKKPENRYASAGALADAVLAAVRGQTAIDPATLMVDPPPDAPLPHQEFAMSQPPQQPPYGRPWDPYQASRRPPYGRPQYPRPPYPPYPGQWPGSPAVVGRPDAGFGPPGGPGRFGGGLPRRRWPLVVALAAAAAAAVIGVAVAVPLLNQDDPPPVTNTTAPPMAVPPTSAPTTTPPGTFVRPPSVAGGDPVADQALWDAVGGTGVTWETGCSYNDPAVVTVTAAATSVLDCRTLDPALDYPLSFESYSSDSETQAEFDAFVPALAGEPGTCDAAGKFTGSLLGRTAACGYLTFDDGTTYYFITWTEVGTAILATVADRDPARAWQWFVAYDPF